MEAVVDDPFPELAILISQNVERLRGIFRSLLIGEGRI
jgi:hypothetical protein